METSENDQNKGTEEPDEDQIDQPQSHEPHPAAFWRRCTPNQKAQVTAGGRILGTNSLSQETMKYVAEAIMYADGFLASVADPRP